MATKMIGIHVPVEYDKKVKEFLNKINKERRRDAGRKMCRSELFITAVNEYIKKHEEKE